MKQGKASYDAVTGTKREPISHAVSETFAGQIGSHFGTSGAARTMYEGRGLKAPMVSETCHKAGLQGKR